MWSVLLFLLTTQDSEVKGQGQLLPLSCLCLSLSLSFISRLPSLPLSLLSFFLLSHLPSSLSLSFCHSNPLILLFHFLAFLPSSLSSSKLFIVVYNKGDPMSWFARTVLGYACCPHVIMPSIFTVKVIWVCITNYIVMLSDPYKEKWGKNINAWPSE